jgi:ADA HAT complex component 1
MQSMFRLPWSTEAPGDKIMEKSALHKSRPLSVVEVPSFMKLKRKHTGSPEPAPQDMHVVKKWKTGQGEAWVKPAVVANVTGVATESVKPVVLQEMPKVVSPDVQESRPKAQPASVEGASKIETFKVQDPAANIDSSSASDPMPAMDAGLSSVQQAIEAQFNYEILLKHNELRLIEQELAKCQVSLEQLRRCSLIPYPGAEGLSEDVSRGLGPALQPPSGFTEPQHAAPWGVTDGPYARHYAKWLIQDPKFDSISERALAQQSHGYFGGGEGRTTRGSFAEFGSTGKARTSRTSTGTLKLQALGENPAPAPKIDPLLHKRSTDGQWVRLYCAQCGHSNFSNTQGFLNHCRIKHSQVFKSHDQAAIACGIPVDIDEVGNPVAASEPASTTATTPAATFPIQSTPGAVHPLIRSNPTQMAKEVHRDVAKAPRDQPKPGPILPVPNFTASSSTPYMNSLLSKRGFEGNLKTLVETARTKVDLGAIEPLDEDGTDSALQTPITAKPPQQLSRLPVVAPNAAPASKVPNARPGSKKGQGNGHVRLSHLPPPVKVDSPVHGNNRHMPGSPVELSPNTVESNPGLVSDHDDDDDEDGYDAHSQSDIVMNDDIVVEDVSDAEGTAERTGSRKGLAGCFEQGEGSRKH